ncbi:MAG: endolytic transglycosylase MltG [Burkholderiaceae bacterium]|nr:MAG: endolytic transglycosylase MltG [Burkholderiaceae bacterium]
MGFHFRRVKLGRRFAAAVALVLLIVAGALAGGIAWWVNQPLALSTRSVDFFIPLGTGLRAAAERMARAGIEVKPALLAAYLKLAARGQTIKAGEYIIERGVKPGDLLAKLIRGDRVVRSVKFLEGWTFAQDREALARAPYLKHDSAGLSDAAVMAALGRPGVPPEGWFFPDTYQYDRGTSSDLSVLREALRLMDQRLAAAWEERAPDLPLKTPEDALILASLIEKETGHAADRAEVAGVFVNRLRKDMPLQTDPSVIYGLGSAYDGRLKRQDLQIDSPFNTYLRRGLPPTPIAMPGEAALMAAVRPAQTNALYFVARGDGSSQFSDSLGDHNRAVNKYLRGGSPDANTAQGAGTSAGAGTGGDTGTGKGASTGKP